MNDANTTALTELLTRLITDGAHHARCAALSKCEEVALVHDGFAAGFHQAAMCTADLLATGSIHWRGAHRVHPDDETAARDVLDRLPDSPAERARLIGEAIRGSNRPLDDRQAQS
ncbi:hypothetical protein [Streptomyces sp. NPDC001404]|uniref:hypothetical protein n=1 Tax=Streptomyces sp. NPDC001404 TaxID=3364571 RepID=UPI00368759B6